MAILNGTAIKHRMKNTDYKEKLVITPLLNEQQIGPSSVDIRIGCSIIVPRKTYMEKQDVTDKTSIRQVEERLYDRVRLRYKSKFMLHPNQLILGATFEYISLPQDVFGIVMSRSSWGRLGLIVATAAAVQPGYHGCLTLELVNVGESPIALYPGLPVGQLVFHEVNMQGKSHDYKGRYNCPTEAELPKFYTADADEELMFWGANNSRA